MAFLSTDVNFFVWFGEEMKLDDNSVLKIFEHFIMSKDTVFEWFMHKFLFLSASAKAHFDPPTCLIYVISSDYAILKETPLQKIAVGIPPVIPGLQWHNRLLSHQSAHTYMGCRKRVTLFLYMGFYSSICPYAHGGCFAVAQNSRDTGIRGKPGRGK